MQALRTAGSVGYYGRSFVAYSEPSERAWPCGVSLTTEQWHEVMAAARGIGDPLDAGHPFVVGLHGDSDWDEEAWEDYKSEHGVVA